MSSLMMLHLGQRTKGALCAKLYVTVYHLGFVLVANVMEFMSWSNIAFSFFPPSLLGRNF